MTKLYLCVCSAQPHTIKRFEAFYQENHPEMLTKFSLDLLVGIGAKFPENLKHRVFRYRRENPFLVTLLAEPLKGNISYMLRFVDVKIEEDPSLEKLKQFYPK